MKSWLIAALALLVPCTAAAAPPTIETGAKHAYAYIGHVNEGGAIEGSRFTNLPDARTLVTSTSAMQGETALASIVEIVASEGVKLRVHPSLVASEIGRAKAGTRFRLHGVVESYGYLWGEVERVTPLDRNPHAAVIYDRPRPIAYHSVHRHATPTPLAMNHALHPSAPPYRWRC